MQSASKPWTRVTEMSPTRSPHEPAKKNTTAGQEEGHARTGDETFHVFGSGNLGLIYVRGEKRAPHPP